MATRYKLATQDRVETLINKTLTTPTISGTGFTNAQHAHSGATSGGQIAHTSLTSIGTNTHAQIDTFISGNVIGSTVQAWSTHLDSIAALARTDSNIIVGNGTTWVAESGATARTSLGVGTGDSPQFTAVNLGHATDTTVTRVSAGLIAVEGDTVALLTATQTLTNKTLTTPTIGSFVNATHNHQAAAGGGILDHGLALTGLSDDDHTQYLLATGARTGASSSSQTFTTGVIDSSLTASRLMASNASKKLSSVSTLSSWIAGTTNQLTVTDDGDGSVTLSLPQNIHTAATPTFARMVLSQTTGTAPLTISSTTVVSNLNADKADGYDFDQDVRVAGTPRFARLGLGAAAGGSDALTVVGHISAESADFDGAVEVTDDLSVVYGGYYPLYVNVNTVTPNNSNVGIMTNTPDPQFALDVAGPARAEMFVGPHALQLADAEMIVHFDGPRPYETDYSGFSTGHMGQVGTESGGVIYRPGKFGKAVQVAEATTNLITNPSFETSTSGWASSWGDALSQSSEQSLYGSYSAKIVGDGVTNGIGIYGDTTGLTAGQTYTLSAWFYVPSTWSGADVYLKAYDGATFVGGTQSATVTERDQWVQRRVTLTSITSTTIRALMFASQNTASTFYVDGVQLENKPHASPYCDGSLGNGHSWSGAAHASASSRTVAYLSYAASGAIQSLSGTFSAWVSLSDDSGSFSLTQPGILRWWDAYNTDSMYLWVGSNGASVNFTSYSGSSLMVNISSAISWLANEWHHVALTWELDNVCLYVDGLLVASDMSWTPPAIVSNMVYVGMQFDSSRVLDGLLDDLVFLSRASDADEIRAIYESDAPVFAESSVFSFRSPTRSPIWVDEEGLWARAYSGNEALGLYAGDASKSWGGKTLYDSHFLIGNSTAGYVHWRSGVNASDPVYGSPVLEIAGEMHVKNNSTIDGSLTMGTGGYIKSGAMAYNSGTGYWLEYNGGTPRLFLGNSEGNKLTWDGTNLNIVGGGTFSGALSAATGSFSGTVTATTGTIGGWTLAATSLKAGSGATTTGLDSGGTNPAFYAGSATPGSAPFRVTQAGALVATSATITGAITASSGSITGPLTMSGASSSIAIGTTPPTSASAGTGLWLDRTGMYGLASSVQQAKFDAVTGAITAGAGAVTLDEDGINITPGVAGYASPNQISWGTWAYSTAYTSGSNYHFRSVVETNAGDPKYLIQATADSGNQATATLSAYDILASGYAQVIVRSGSGVNSVTLTADDIDLSATNGVTVNNLNLDGNTLSSTLGAVTVAPLAGQNLNVSLSGTGDFVVNTNQLYVDTSTGNVGIGTTAPSVKLDVNGTVKSTSLAANGWDATGLSGNNIFIGYHPSGYASVLGYNYPGSGYADLSLGNSAVYIKSTGNVGIGTTAPTSKLDVITATQYSGLRLGNATNPLLKVYPNSAGIEDAVLALYTGNVVKVQLNTNGLSYLNGGNVGIGTTAPSSILHVAATAVAGETSTATLQNLSTSGANGSALVFWNHLSNAAYQAKIVGQRNNDSYGTSLNFYTQDNSAGASLTQKMVIDKYGNVGIGYSSPLYKLDINGDVYIDADLTTGGNIVTNGYMAASHFTNQSIAGSSTWSTGRAPATGTMYMVFVIVMSSSSGNIVEACQWHVSKSATSLIGIIGGTATDHQLTWSGSNIAVQNLNASTRYVHISITRVI